MTTIGYSIPLDLIIEILLKLPAISVSRFRYVSKSWFSIITSQQFIDAFMSVYVPRPRLVIASYDSNDDRMLFNFSSHQSGSFLSSSSMLFAEKNTLTMPKVKSYNHRICFINSVRGFVCCRIGNQFVVCNPTTGQVISLSEKNYDNYICSMYLGYDSNRDQYKVFRFSKFSNSHVEHSVCTLGGQRSSNSWRPIRASIPYDICNNDGVCIDGVVYYQYKNHHDTVLSSFDVGSEQLRLIQTPEEYLTGDLTEYIGNLAVHRSFYNGFILWVLEDVKNQVWFKKTRFFQSLTDSMFSSYAFAGINVSGEIVYVRPRFYDHPIQLFCYDVENKMERRIKLEELRNFDLSFLLSSCVENMFYL